MVDIGDIPDFPNMPGQRPTPGAPSGVSPVAVVLVSAPLDEAGAATPLNAAAVDTYIAAEIAAGRAYQTTVERWNPWTDLDVSLGYAAAMGYNYARFTLDGRQFYAFVSAVYQNLTTTTLVPTPDDWTTYAPSIGYSTIVRGHVAVAAAVNDPYGNVYMTAAEPVDAAPVRSVLDASILDAATSSWRVLVVSANDLRGSGADPYFEHHIREFDIGQAAGFASSATVNKAGMEQVTVPEANYPWKVGTGGGGSPAIAEYYAEDNWTSPYGEDRGGGTYHRGQDIGAGAGTPTPALRSGVVSDVFVTEALGGVVMVQVGDEFDGYSHQVPGTAIGTAITAGDTIGTVAGYDDPYHHGTAWEGPHLHFTITSSGVPWSGDRDPRPDILAALAGGSGEFGLFVPKVTPSPVSRIDGVAAGGGVYVFTLEGYAAYMTVMQGAPWVTAGIVSTSIVPAWSVGSAGNAAYAGAVPPQDPLSPAWDAAAAIPVYYESLDSGTTTASVLGGWRSSLASAMGLGHYRKLLTSQFTRIVVSDGETNHEFAPEVWTTNAVGFEVVSEATHGTPVARAIPTGYTALGEQMGVAFALGGSLGRAQAGRALATSNTAQQDMGPWMAAWAAFTQRIVLQDQQSLALTLGLESARMQLGVQGIQTMLSAAGSAPGGPAAVAQNAFSGVSSLATSAITANNNLDLLDISQDGSFDIATYQLGLSGLTSALSFDAWAQSLSAVSGQGSPHTLAGAWRAIVGRGLSVMISAPNDDAIGRALATWRRYGYMVDRAFVPPRLDAMDRYTYWQMDSPAVLGAMPADARARIVERFERGTTIWTNVAEIGTMPANEPRSGIAY